MQSISHSKDYYRDGVPEPSKGSRFDREYESYKDDDAYADGAKDNYDEYVRTAGHYPGKIRNASPYIYKGNPLETKYWHKSAGSYADIVSSTARMYVPLPALLLNLILHEAPEYSPGTRSASESRDKFSKDYIGYDDKRSAKGHKERTDNLKSRSRRFEKRREEHYGYFGQELALKTVGRDRSSESLHGQQRRKSRSPLG